MLSMVSKDVVATVTKDVTVLTTAMVSIVGPQVVGVAVVTSSAASPGVRCLFRTLIFKQIQWMGALTLLEVQAAQGVSGNVPSWKCREVIV